MSYFFFYHDFKEKEQIKLISNLFTTYLATVEVEGIEIEGIMVYFKELTEIEVITKICKIKEDSSKRYSWKTIDCYYGVDKKVLKDCNIIL